MANILFSIMFIHIVYQELPWIFSMIYVDHACLPNFKESQSIVLRYKFKEIQSGLVYLVGTGLIFYCLFVSGSVLLYYYINISISPWSNCRNNLHLYTWMHFKTVAPPPNKHQRRARRIINYNYNICSNNICNVEP